MTHKILKLGIIAIFACTLSSCGEKANTEGWSVIWLDEIYSISFPSDWILTKIEGRIILSDRELGQTDLTIHMMEVDVQQNSPTDAVIYTGPLFYGERVKPIKSEMNSNGTFYTINTVKIEDHIEEYRFLVINLRDSRITFVVVDSNVKTSVLRTILETKRIKVN